MEIPWWELSRSYCAHSIFFFNYRRFLFLEVLDLSEHSQDKILSLQTNRSNKTHLCHLGFYRQQARKMCLKQNNFLGVYGPSHTAAPLFQAKKVKKIGSNLWQRPPSISTTPIKINNEITQLCWHSAVGGKLIMSLEEEWVSRFELQDAGKSLVEGTESGTATASGRRRSRPCSEEQQSQLPCFCQGTCWPS